MRTAIETKYSLIKYYYTELSLIHANGGSFFKPLFFEFPFYDDPGTYEDQENNVMLGSRLKLSILTNALD